MQFLNLWLNEIKEYHQKEMKMFFFNFRQL